MGCCTLPQCMLVCHTTQYSSLILLCFLILSSSSHVIFLAEGTAIPKLDNMVSKLPNPNEEKNKEVKVRYLIGSRPPRCERRCGSCGHCKAVKVPIVPGMMISHDHHQADEAMTIAYSRGDDISNYKPTCWKCKCGDLFFNP